MAETVSNATPNVGDQITFTVTLSDNSPGVATGVQVIDLLPAGVSFVAAAPSQGTYDSASGLWTVGTISSGVAQTLNIIGTVVSPTAADQHRDASATPTSSTRTPPTPPPVSPKRPSRPICPSRKR